MGISTGNKKIVLMPVDGSNHSERAFQWYLDNLRSEDDELLFVCVIEPIFATPIIELAMASPPITDIMQSMQDNIENGKKMLQKYLMKARKHGVVCQGFAHVDAKPGPTLVKVADEHKVDIIIMGSRGLGMIRRTLLGSVTNYIMHHSKTPLVVIPPPIK